MEVTPAPFTAVLETDKKRPCIRVKARIKIQGEQQSLNPTIEARRPYQAYCETVTTSRSQSPDIFTTPPTHSEPFEPVRLTLAPTYTARITTRSYRAAHLQQVAVPETSNDKSTDRDVAVHRVSLQKDVTVQQLTTPCGSQPETSTGRMSRNRTSSFSHVQQANILPQPTAQTINQRTPLRQKRYGRMEYHPLPPLPPSPPDSPVHVTDEQQEVRKTTVNFSRGEISPKPMQSIKQTKASHRACGDVFVSPIELTAPTQDTNQPSVPAEERPLSKASRRTVTFADDDTISSRSSSPDHHSPVQDRALRQSKSFSSEAQVPSSLRLYRSHDSLLATKAVSKSDLSANASRRTTPKDFKHKYHFGQRPASRMPPSSGLGRTNNPNYNPRLSTSKAQYRGLASLPRPLPSSLRIAQPSTGPRQPPWGSLGDLDEQREKRVDARERDQAKQFRAATLSEATTLASVDSFGKDKMKKEVEEYKEQVMSVYPDMAFDGNAGKGGRSCCCTVM